MPELPEVRTVAKGLKEHIIGKILEDIMINNIKICQDDIKPLIGQKVVDIKTHGKLIIIIFTQNVLLVHLRMEGKFYLEEKQHQVIKHEHIVFIFDDFDLVYHDTRIFGKMYLRNLGNYFKTPPYTRIGPEPYNVDVDFLSKQIHKIKAPIKATLLDQTFISGLGNIYVDEVLFLSCILPTTKTCDLTKTQINLIVNNAIFILNKAISLSGTTIKSYRSFGSTGANKLLVHSKKDLPCPNCQTLIKKIKVVGRGTYFCENCQK